MTDDTTRIGKRRKYAATPAVRKENRLVANLNNTIAEQKITIATHNNTIDNLRDDITKHLHKIRELQQELKAASEALSSTPPVLPKVDWQYVKTLQLLAKTLQDGLNDIISTGTGNLR